MHGKPFVWVPRGTVLDVVGFTHDWAAVDITDRAGTAKLGFVHRSRITPP
jgi:hypothetical protein